MKESIPPVEELPWLAASGPESAQVISTRVRLARNLHGLPFRQLASERADSTGARVAARVEEVLGWAGTGLIHLGNLSATERLLLHERQLVSRDLARAGMAPGGGEALLLAPEASAMVNEEDHLRIQGLSAGFSLVDAHAAADRLDTLLGARLCFAFHPEFGYLTSCPTNVGTGLRASVLIHLPGLAHTGELVRVLRGLGQLGLTHRGWHGEGSAMLGHLVQLSNQTTLGWTEGDLLNHLARLVRQVIECEARARDVMWRDAASLLDDRIWRAYGTLRHARRLSLEEALEQLSLVRLGAGRGQGPVVDLAVLNRLLVKVQTAHVAQAAGIGLDDDAIASHRATVVRRELGEKGDRI